MFVTAVCKYPCAVPILAVRWGGGGWCFASLGEEGGRQRVNNWQELKSLPLRCVISRGEEGETAMVPGAWLLSLTMLFLWGLLHSKLVSENLSSLTCCAHPAEAGRPPGQSTQLAGSRCQASRQSLAAMPSAFPFFFPAQFPLNICQRWPMLQQLKPPLPSWSRKVEVMLVLACSSRLAFVTAQFMV